MRIATLGNGKRSAALATLAALAGLCVLGAAPAHAENDFANGFEDQLGRLVAVEAFQFAHFVLSGGYAPVAIGYAPAYAPVYAPPPRWRAPRAHYRGHDCRSHRGRGHGHGHDRYADRGHRDRRDSYRGRGYDDYYDD